MLLPGTSNLLTGAIHDITSVCCEITPAQFCRIPTPALFPIPTIPGFRDSPFAFRAKNRPGTILTRALYFLRQDFSSHHASCLYFRFVRRRDDAGPHDVPWLTSRWKECEHKLRLYPSTCLDRCMEPGKRFAEQDK